MVKSEQNPDYSARPTVAKFKKKVKSLYLTSVVPSVTRLVSVEADGAPFTPPASVSDPFYGCSKLWLQDQTKVETDVEVTEVRTGDLSLRKPTEPRLLLFLN